MQDNKITKPFTAPYKGRKTTPDYLRKVRQNRLPCPIIEQRIGNTERK